MDRCVTFEVKFLGRRLHRTYGDSDPLFVTQSLQDFKDTRYIAFANLTSFLNGIFLLCIYNRRSSEIFKSLSSAQKFCLFLLFLIS